MPIAPKGAAEAVGFSPCHTICRPSGAFHGVGFRIPRTDVLGYFLTPLPGLPWIIGLFALPVLKDDRVAGPKSAWPRITNLGGMLSRCEAVGEHGFAHRTWSPRLTPMRPCHPTRRVAGLKSAWPRITNLGGMLSRCEAVGEHGFAHRTWSPRLTPMRPCHPKRRVAGPKSAWPRISQSRVRETASDAWNLD